MDSDKMEEEVGREPVRGWALPTEWSGHCGKRGRVSRAPWLGKRCKCREVGAALREFVNGITILAADFNEC